MCEQCAYYPWDGHAANLNVGYPPRAAVLGLAGGRGVAAKVPDACPRPPSRVWLQPRASAAAHLSLAQPQHFTCCLVTATSASPHLTATPAHYYFRYYSDNGVIALLATVLSHPGYPSGNATNELHSVRYAAEYIQRSNQLHLAEKQKFPLCMNV